jgi:hypothetical protein
MLSCVASCRDGLQHMSALASVLPCPVPISARSLCRGNRARQSFKDRFSMRPHSAYCEYSLDRHTVSTAGSRTHGGKTTAYRLRRRTAARLLLGYLGACLLGSLGLLLRRRTRIRALCSSQSEYRYNTESSAERSRTCLCPCIHNPYRDHIRTTVPASAREYLGCRSSPAALEHQRRDPLYCSMRRPRRTDSRCRRSLRRGAHRHSGSRSAARVPRLVR